MGKRQEIRRRTIKPGATPACARLAAARRATRAKTLAAARIAEKAERQARTARHKQEARQQLAYVEELERLARSISGNVPGGTAHRSGRPHRQARSGVHHR